MSNPLDDMVTDPSDTFVVQRDDATLEGLDLDYDDVYKLASAPQVMDEFRSVDGTLSEVSQTVSGMANESTVYAEVREVTLRARTFTETFNIGQVPRQILGDDLNRRRVCLRTDTAMLIAFEQFIAPSSLNDSGPYFVLPEFTVVEITYTGRIWAWSAEAAASPAVLSVLAEFYE